MDTHTDPFVDIQIPMHRRPRLLLPTLLVLLLAPIPGVGQSDTKVTWHGEIRPRMESRTPVAGDWDQFVSMRTRIQLDVRLEEGLGAFFQIQDLRLWGEESSPRDRSADQIDFHQAYLEMGDLPGLGGLIRAGRQEVGLGQSRLIGAPNWGQGGQSFDGLRWTRSSGGHSVDVVALKTMEDSGADHDQNGEFMAAYYRLPEAALGRTQLLLVRNQESGPDPTRQNSLGAIWEKSWQPFAIFLQGIRQFGTREGLDVEASLLSARGTAEFPDQKTRATLQFDRLSGKGPSAPGKTGAFSTLYGARNRYYGRADYFVDMPNDLQGLGLEDAALKFTFSPTPALSLNLDLHTFHTAAQGDLSTSHLGEEADLWFRYLTGKGLTLEGGYFHTVAAAAMEELQLLQGTGRFMYVMTSLTF